MLFGPNVPGVLELEPAGTMPMESGTLFPVGALPGMSTSTSYTPIKPGAKCALSTCTDTEDPGNPTCSAPATLDSTL